jgi:hypothetical protein
VPEHLAALDRLGPTVHHRRFFAPVVAAREKHQAITIQDGTIEDRTIEDRALEDLLSARDTIEISAAAI